MRPSDSIFKLGLRRFGSGRIKLWAATITAIIVVTYSSTFEVPLLFDDHPATDNPSIRRLWPLTEVFSPPPTAPTAGRPLVNLTLAINYELSGMAPWSYHAANLVIHVLAALTLFGVIRRTLLTPRFVTVWGESSGSLAGMIALLWGIHPVQTQTITYISQRSESLMALFYLLTLYSFIRGTGNRTNLWYLGAAAACLLGALCKEVIVTAPLVILLYDRTFFAGSFRSALQQRKIFYLALASTWLVTAWLLVDVKIRGVGFGIGVSSFHYALTQCKAISVYLGLSLWPSPLIFDRGTEVITSIGQVLPYAPILAALIAISAWACVRKQASGFALAWFLVLLAPASSVVPVIGATIAENRIYLPLAGVVALVVLSMYRCFSSRVTSVICATVALAFAMGTYARNRDFQSEIGIWTDTVAKAPGNSRAHYNLGNLLAATSDQKTKALGHYLAALRLSPNYANAHYNLARLLVMMPDQKTEALMHYAEALRLKPDFPEAHNNLAELLGSMPHRQLEALVHYEEALRLKPDYADAHNNFANLLATMPGKQPEAFAHYTEALRLKPDHAEAHYNLGLFLAGIPNRKLEALGHYAEALRLKPDNANAHNNIALILAAMPNRGTEALSHYEKALQLNPNFVEAHYNLAMLLASIPHRRSEALVHYSNALQLKPDSAEVHNNFAALLATMPDRQAEALEHYTEAARLLPDSPVIHFNLARQLEKIPSRKAEAESHFLKAIALDPGFSAARERLDRLRQ